MIKDRTTHPEADSFGDGRTQARRGLLWVLCSAEYMRDLPAQNPSPATCWCRSQECENASVWLNFFRKVSGEPNNKCILSWDKTFSDGTFSPAQITVSGINKAKRGQGKKLVVVADGRSVPLRVRIAPASPAEVTLIESTLERVAVPRSGPGRPRTKPRRLTYDKAADGNALGLRLKTPEIELIRPHPSSRKRPLLENGRSLPRYSCHWAIDRFMTWLGNFRRRFVRHERNPICCWPS